MIVFPQFFTFASTMKRSSSLFFLLLLIGTWPFDGLWSQEELPKLLPSNLSVFDIDAGMPISCINNGLFGVNGTLWINPCSGQEEHQTINFYRFDGHQSALVEWQNLPEKVKGQAFLSCFTKSGVLIGYFRGSNTIFCFDPQSQATQYFTLDSIEAKISFIGITESHGVIVHAMTPNNHLIYQCPQGQPTLLKAIPRRVKGIKTNVLASDEMLLTETDLWVVRPIKEVNTQTLIENEPDLLGLIRFNLSNHEVYEFNLKDLYPGKIPAPVRIEKGWVLAQGSHNKVILFLTAWSQFFLIDPVDNSVKKYQSEGIGDILRSFNKKDFSARFFIKRDNIGNLLYYYKWRNDIYAILEDTNGQYYDYSSILNTARKNSRFPQSGINDIISSNFLKQVYVFMNSGLAVVDIKYSSSISVRLDELAVRNISEIGPGQYFTFPEPADWFVQFKTGEGTSDKFNYPYKFDCLRSPARPTGPKHLIDIVKDARDGFWVPFDKQLVRLYPNGNCNSYAVGKDFMKFAFIDTSTIIFASDNQVYLYHIPDRKLSPVEGNQQPLRINGVVNQFYVSKNKVVWIAALDGLHRVDLKTGAYRLFTKENGFSDNRIMCVEEDDTGRFWLGTYGGGVQIFDPESEKVTVIDQKSGLSNNIVVGILSDDEGSHWVSTFEGLNLVSPAGKVLSRLFKEDGLSSNEFNRYSYFRGGNGELLFGSVAGINIIRPELLKPQLLDTASIRIFLTGYSYYDSNTDSLIKKINWSDSIDIIKLSAANRTISLQFALASLVRLEANTFAYKLEGPDHKGSDEWIYLGTNNSLNLQGLPAGNYRILIRGFDYRGTGTSNVLVIPIHAAEFFYKRTWFILLCICFVVSAVLIWVNRLQMQRKKLERELKARSQEIMNTRNQLVAQEKLASLGQLTAGIAHEIKNPLNFINNFALDSSKLADKVFEELKQAGQISGSDSYKKMMRYLEDLKQNALDINSSGSTADRIVRNMMDHARGTSEKMQELDLNHLVTETIHLAVKGFKATHPGFLINVTETYDSDIQSIYGSPLNLSRALLNIMNNACFALFEKKEQDGVPFTPAIDIQTKAINQQAEIRIRDNGPGIDPIVKLNIFTPFFTTKPTGGGNTGLGLSITHDIIVNEHKGKIEVESIPKEFTMFILQIPFSPDIQSSSLTEL